MNNNHEWAKGISNNPNCITGTTIVNVIRESTPMMNTLKESPTMDEVKEATTIAN